MPMQEIDPVVQKDKIRIPLSKIQEHDIVYFEHENDQGFPVPLTAYVTPSGRIFTGSSICEPCQGRRWAIDGDLLYCMKCGTTFKLENHEFVSGSSVCGDYPPVFMSHEIRNEEVIIPEKEVLSWRNRAL